MSFALTSFAGPGLAAWSLAEAPSVSDADPGAAGDRAMARYATGDDAAFGAVHAALADRLRSFLMRLARSPATADDLLQETFLRIHRARGSFLPGARLVPWGYAIARNVWVDHVRARGVRRESTVADGPDLPSHDGDGEEIAIAREAATVVEETLARLPPNQREAFVLIRYEGLRVDEAAAVLGVTENAVKLRAFHAYEALRAALGRTKKRGTP